MDFLSRTLFGNPLSNWLAALILFLGVVVLVILGRLALLRLIHARQKRGMASHELLESLVKRTRLSLIFLLALYLAANPLELPPVVSRLFEVLAVVGAALQCALWGLAAIDFWVGKRVKAEPGDEAVNATTMGAVSLIAKIALWSVVVLVILQNITGMDLNALIAALGIGGVAIALAVQNILSDLFSSVSIALDKPFVLGDDIAVGNLRGTVEHIGLKSTRVRSFTGEQLVFSNSDLLSSRIHNFQRLQRRRITFEVHVSPTTPQEKLPAIPKILQACIEAQAQVTFATANFKEIGAYGLVFECAYYVETPAFQAYLDARQAINFEMTRRFASEGIELAFANAALLGEKSPAS